MLEDRIIVQDRGIDAGLAALMQICSCRLSMVIKMQ